MTNRFYNNLCLKTGGVIQNYNTSYDTLFNCIFWKNHAEISGNFIGSEGGLNVYMDHCLIDADSCEALQEGLFISNPNIPYNILKCGAHNIWNIDPAPRDTSNGDYRLSACSPARNAGDSIWVQRFQLFNDHDNLPRILENLPDLGAYETPASPWVITTEVTNASSVSASNGSAVVQFINGGTVPYTYQWSDGSTTAAMENVLPGIYQLMIADAHGCDTLLVFEIGFSSSTDDTQNNFQVLLTPNMIAQNMPVQFTVQSDFARDAMLLVSDMLGRNRLQTILFIPSGASTYSIPLSLNSGTYYLQLQHAHNQIVPLKFVIGP